MQKLQQSLLAFCQRTQKRSWVQIDCFVRFGNCDSDEMWYSIPLINRQLIIVVEWIILVTAFTYLNYNYNALTDPDFDAINGNIDCNWLAPVMPNNLRLNHRLLDRLNDYFVGEFDKWRKLLYLYWNPPLRNRKAINFAINFAFRRGWGQ